MASSQLLLIFTVLSLSFSNALPNQELSALMALKASLDPSGHVLSSWASNGDPCNGSFEGLSCNVHGKVTSVSLQGMGLSGSVSPAINGLKWLTGLYLHYNELVGEIPREIGELKGLSELYLDVNRLSGRIPVEIGSLKNLQVLQLCYNKLTGNIPTQMGRLKKLSVLALQSNNLTGAIPATIGDLPNLTRLDLSSNHLFGSIPSKLAQIPFLEILDLRNNSLSGNIPSGLKRLNGGLQLGNNKALCGSGFDSLKLCKSTDSLNKPGKPEPFNSQQIIPQSANLGTSNPNSNSKSNSNSPKSVTGTVVIIGIIVLLILCGIAVLCFFLWYRRRKQRIGSSMEVLDSRLSTDQFKEINRRSSSVLLNMEYNSSNWEIRDFDESYKFNLEEIEFATQYFSEANLLGKSTYIGSTYKGILRDGSKVAVRKINRTSCKQDESEFLKGLKILTLLRHENVLGLRGFCCSKGRGECFLISDFAQNGSLSQYLKNSWVDNEKVLDWPTRVDIIKGIAKGIQYLHSNKSIKPTILHQNISADKILLDIHFVPKLSSSGLHKILADDINFATLKSSAAMGYLAPEYSTTGRFTEKSDIYSFGILILQIISGKLEVSSLAVNGDEVRVEEIVDERLQGRFSKKEALKLVGIAGSCTNENLSRRPRIEMVVQEFEF
ncbi:hypothetical protein LUZ60_007246 [Juncus effusus]|nr:hypothetical protein LUZ60_007246 [Juncus effusus]